MTFDEFTEQHRRPLQDRLLELAQTAVLGLPQRHVTPTSDAAHTGLGVSELQVMLIGQLASGGKRLRALLPPAIVAAAGGPVRAAVELGACVELVHNGTLVHDDVQDNDRLRRGQPTLWAVHGMPQAINAGDALLLAPIALLLRTPEMADGHRIAIAGLLAEALVETVRGQVADIALRDDPAITVEQLTEVHLAKTGPLFGVCLEGAAILLGGGAHQRAAAQSTARALGVAFQVRDDLLDIVGTKGRGDAGADLREGKVTAPVLLAMTHAPVAECAELRAMLRQAVASAGVDDATVAHWVRWTVAHGGADRARVWLQELLEQARVHSVTAFGEPAAAVVAALCDRLAKLDG